MWAGTKAQEHVHAWTQEARAAALGALHSCVHSSEPGLSPLWTALTALPPAADCAEKRDGRPPQKAKGEKGSGVIVPHFPPTH